LEHSVQGNALPACCIEGRQVLVSATAYLTQVVTGVVHFLSLTKKRKERGQDMTKSKSREMERQAVRTVATMMASSARTAPKARGIDAMETMILDGDDLEALAGGEVGQSTQCRQSCYVHNWSCS